MNKHETIDKSVQEISQFFNHIANIDLNNAQLLEIHRVFHGLYSDAFKHGKVQAYKDILNKVKKSKDETTKEC